MNPYYTIDKLVTVAITTKLRLSLFFAPPHPSIIPLWTIIHQYEQLGFRFTNIAQLLLTKNHHYSPSFSIIRTIFMNMIDHSLVTRAITSHHHSASSHHRKSSTVPEQLDQPTTSPRPGSPRTSPGRAPRLALEAAPRPAGGASFARRPCVWAATGWPGEAISNILVNNDG